MKPKAQVEYRPIADLIDRIRITESGARMEFHMPTDDRPYIQFVNSDYFVAGSYEDLRERFHRLMEHEI